MKPTRRDLRAGLGAHALLLAAGAGRRFGGDKLVHLFEGEPLVRHAARRALGSPVETVTAVLGCDADAVAAALRPLSGPRLRFAHAPDWAEGIAASLRAGVAALPPDWRTALVYLGDMPRVPADVSPLLNALEGGAPAARFRHAGRPGHPVAFTRGWWDGMPAPAGDAGLQAMLRTATGLQLVDSPDLGALFDVDRRADAFPD